MASLTCNKTDPQSVLNPLTENYNYDAVDQLIEAKYGTARAVGYQYDAVGNRQWVSDNGTTAHYTANSDNGYTSVDGVSTETDLNGNMVAFPLKTENGTLKTGIYAYDAQNRLTSATVNGVTTEFTYDSRNRVVQRTSGNGTLNLTYSGWHLIEERNASGALDQVYVHGVGTDEILVKITPTGPAYYHHDGLGSTIALTGENGELLESYRYDAFGAATVYDSSGSALPASPRENRFLFTGREWLSQVGLYDYRNRVYSTQIGRFLQTDPIRFAAGDVNIYRYVSNNPINLWDPLGLETEIFIHRNAPAAGQPARNASGTMSVFHDGQFQFSTPVNQYGYQEGSNGIYPGTYSVLPRTDADPTSVYRNGTPAVTAPGQTNPGNAGNGYRNVYIHREANMAGGDSRGCPTVSADAAQRIRDFMDADQRRGENTTLRIFNYGGAPMGVPTR